MRTRHYYLKGRKICYTDDWEEWLELAGNFDRQLADTTVDCYRISTVFLMIDHRMSGKGPPILFETMVFTQGEPGRETGGWMQRYSSFQGALDGHNDTVDLVRAAVAEALEAASQLITNIQQETHNAEGN